jgi:hypothetical protein
MEPYHIGILHPPKTWSNLRLFYEMNLNDGGKMHAGFECDTAPMTAAVLSDKIIRPTCISVPYTPMSFKVQYNFHTLILPNIFKSGLFSICDLPL